MPGETDADAGSPGPESRYNLPTVKSPVPGEDGHPASSSDAASTFQLLERANSGEAAALEALFDRYLKPLQRWASGRLPRWARSANDTHDLVQDTLLNAFKRIGSFEPRREGAFQAYLRQAVMNRISSTDTECSASAAGFSPKSANSPLEQAVMNRIRDELRRTRVRPATATFDELDHEHGASPLEDAIELETFERYETALAQLKDEEREAIIGRVELGQSYEDLATSLGSPSPDAARKTTARALVRLAEAMKHERRR